MRQRGGQFGGLGSANLGGPTGESYRDTACLSTDVLVQSGPCPVVSHPVEGKGTKLLTMMHLSATSGQDHQFLRKLLPHLQICRQHQEAINLYK